MTDRAPPPPPSLDALRARIRSWREAARLTRVLETEVVVHRHVDLLGFFAGEDRHPLTEEAVEACPICAAIARDDPSTPRHPEVPMSSDPSATATPPDEQVRPACPALLDRALERGLPYVDGAFLIPRDLPPDVPEGAIERRHVGFSMGLYGVHPFGRSYPWLGDALTSLSYLRWARSQILGGPAHTVRRPAALHLVDRIDECWRRVLAWEDGRRRLDEELRVATLLHDVMLLLVPLSGVRPTKEA